MMETTARIVAADNSHVRRIGNRMVHASGMVGGALRGVLTAMAGLIMPVGWVADSAARPVAEVCLGSGDIMSLVAAANALTLIP